jgi:hypothetical protein
LFSRKPLPRSLEEQSRLDGGLIIAAENGDTNKVHSLLAAGANVHARNGEALYRAAFWGRAEMVRVLATNIFAADGWCGKSRNEIEGQARALYEKIKTTYPSFPIKPEYLQKAGTVFVECATDCWHRVRPAPQLNISPTPTKLRPS